jgi:hypothetical protein
MAESNGIREITRTAIRRNASDGLKVLGLISGTPFGGFKRRGPLARLGT